MSGRTFTLVFDSDSFVDFPRIRHPQSKGYENWLEEKRPYSLSYILHPLAERLIEELNHKVMKEEMVEVVMLYTNYFPEFSYPFRDSLRTRFNSRVTFYSRVIPRANLPINTLVLAGYPSPSHSSEKCYLISNHINITRKRTMNPAHQFFRERLVEVDTEVGLTRENVLRVENLLSLEEVKQRAPEPDARSFQKTQFFRDLQNRF